MPKLTYFLFHPQTKIFFLVSLKNYFALKRGGAQVMIPIITKMPLDSRVDYGMSATERIIALSSLEFPLLSRLVSIRDGAAA